MLTAKEEMELIQLLELQRQEEAKQAWQDSAEDFIEQAVQIEDRDSVELAVPFTLWGNQKKALHDFIYKRLNIVLKARQLGLTWLALAYAIWCMVFNAGYLVVALSKKEDPDAKELIRRVEFILRHLPSWLIVHKKDILPTYDGLYWDSTALSVTIFHPDKEPSKFQSMAAAPDSGRSFTANLVILDEWAFQQWAREIWSAAYPTINRPTGGKVIGLSTAKRMTLFEDIWRMATAGQNTFNRIFLSWRTDPRRTDEWYEQTKKDLPNSYKAEYPNTPEEAFEAAEGAAFPEFSYNIHVCKSFRVPEYWTKWRSVDNGYNDPYAWYWLAVSDDGVVHIYREFTRDYEDEKLIYSDQAKRVAGLTGSEDIHYTVAGLDAWSSHHRDQSGKTLINYYQEGGLYGFTKCVNDRALRKATWHEYLKPYKDIDGNWTAKIQIHDCCKKLIETLPQLLVDPKDNEKVAESSFDHWYDSVGYGIISHHMGSSKEVKEEKPLPFPFHTPEPPNNGFMNW